jgi:F420-0:gamma-glutamyl ligase-like protein
LWASDILHGGTTEKCKLNVLAKRKMVRIATHRVLLQEQVLHRLVALALNPPLLNVYRVIYWIQTLIVNVLGVQLQLKSVQIQYLHQHKEDNKNIY